MGTSINKTAAIAAIGLAMIPGVGLSQDEADTGGLVLTFGISSTLTFDDNFELAEGGSPGDSTIWDTGLSFRVQSVTPTESFDLLASSVLRWADLPTRSVTGFEDPTVALTYRREGAASLFTAEARIRSVDLEFLGPLSDPGGPGNDLGTLDEKTARVTLETGIGEPLGVRLTAGYADSDYSDTVDPDLFDSTETDVGARVNFRVTPVAVAFVDLSRTWYSDEDVGNKDETTDTLSVGVDYEADRRTRLSLSVGYSVVNTNEFGIDTENDGIVYSLGAERDLPNGTVSVLLTSELDEDDAITTLTFGRTMELPRGRLEGEIGVTQLANGSRGLIGSLTYGQDLRNDRIEVTLDRSFATDDGNDEINTRLGVTYAHDIDASSTLGVEFAYAVTEDGGVGTTPTEQEASLRASYTREITRDWNLEGGVIFRYSDDESVPGTARSNAVYLTIGREFSFRP